MLPLQSYVYIIPTLSNNRTELWKGINLINDFRKGRTGLRESYLDPVPYLISYQLVGRGGGKEM